MSLVRTDRGYAIQQYLGYPQGYVGVRRALGPIAEQQGEWNLLKPVQATGGDAKALIQKTLARAEASPWAVSARPGVREPMLVEYPRPRGYPISQVQSRIVYPRPSLRVRYVLDL